MQALVALDGIVVNRFWSRDVGRRREARAYRCKRCGGWHLTSARKRGRA